MCIRDRSKRTDKDLHRAVMVHAQLVRKDQLQRMAAIGMILNAGRRGYNPHAAVRCHTCCGEKQRMLYSTEKSTNSTTEFVKMVVESQK